MSIQPLLCPFVQTLNLNVNLPVVVDPEELFTVPTVV